MPDNQYTGPNSEPSDPTAGAQRVNWGTSDQKASDQKREDTDKGRADPNDDTPMHNYRVLEQHTIIDGKRYTDSDKKGGFGEVQLSERYAAQMQEHGVRLVCLDKNEEEEEDENNYEGK